MGVMCVFKGGGGGDSDKTNELSEHGDRVS
jgi:hypothetical protein